METSNILMEYKVDNITFEVQRVTLEKSEIESNISVLLKNYENEKEFTVTTDKISSVKRALKKKDSQEQQRSLFRLIRKDLKTPVMDWIYNATNEDIPFSWTPEPIKNIQTKNKKMLVSKTVEPKPLFLILKGTYFDQIIAGTKTIEYRDNTPFYTSRLMRDGKYRNFETVIFQEGYNKNARRMTVEIEKVILTGGLFEIHLGAITERNF